MNTIKRRRSTGVLLSLAVATVATTGTVTTARAMPATTDYDCVPDLPKGNRISVDFNSGGNSITITFPNGTSLHMAKAKSASGVRYVGKNVEAFDKGGTTLFLNVKGQPARTCTALQPK